MNSDDTALLVIDVQERLVPHIDQHDTVVANIEKLIRAAQVLGVATRATEQYPKGLGATIESLRVALEESSDRTGFSSQEKIMFSCRECESMFAELSEAGIGKLLLCGIETHVCVAQTAIDLMASGFQVYVAVDAVGARNKIDHDVALKRMESSGATLTTTEAAMFEWCERAGSETFKSISRLVQGQRA